MKQLILEELYVRLPPSQSRLFRIGVMQMRENSYGKDSPDHDKPVSAESPKVGPNAANTHETEEPVLTSTCLCCSVSKRSPAYPFQLFLVARPKPTRRGAGKRRTVPPARKASCTPRLRMLVDDLA